MICPFPANFTTPTVSAPGPAISAVTTSNISSTSAVITWTTDQPSTSLVNFGTTTGYGSASTLATTLVTSHTVTLTGLTPGTIYDFDVVSANSSAVSSVSSNATLTTTSVASTPPVISNVFTTSVSQNSVTVTWTTDQPSSSLVNYGMTTSYGTSSGLNSTLVTAHSVTLTGLAAGTTYNFDVTSANAAAQSTTSPNGTVTTTAANAIPPFVGYVAAWGVNNSGATVTWSTDFAANTQLAYGTTMALGQLSPLQTAMTASHGVILTGLVSGTTYYFVAQSTGANGATGYSAVMTFTTLGTAPSGPPAISNVLVSGISNTTATITWTTDQASSSLVNFGTTTGYGSASPLNPTLVTTHTVTLTGLTPGTTYDFDVISASLGGMSSTSANATFLTTNVTFTQPVISNVATTNLTSNSVTVTWTTDQPSSSKINYGTTTAYGSSTTLDTNLVTAHSETITGLAASTTYDFDVTSTTAASLSSTSPNSTFTTPATTATPPYVGYVAAWGINNTGATVTWSTDVAATAQLAYGTTTALGQLSPLQSAMTASHGVTLTGLNPGTQYYFVAQSTGANGATGYSPVMNFTTLGTQTTPPPLISNVTATSITDTTAIITWTTDQPSSSQLNYGLTTTYTLSSTLNPTLVTSHSVTLTGLSPAATYNFDVMSANASAVSSTSTNYTFSTTGTAPAPVITNVNSSSVTSGTATIAWTTDQASSSVVNYGTTTGYGSTASVASLVASHSVVLTGLTPNTTYNFDVVSANAANSSSTSSNFTFHTSSNTAPPPVISYLSYWGITATEVTITWSTYVPANTAVTYGTTNALGQLSPVQTALSTSHGVTLTGLAAGTTYYFEAQSADGSGNTGYSTMYSFTTLPGPPTISGVTASPAANNKATISWTTSVPTNSYVQYGLSTNYGYYSALTSLTTAPHCTLSYVPSGTVHYQLVSTDANGNTTTSPDMTLTAP
ncbi:MAG: fibronectin type III domain-containing protein [Acidobacteriota bacterium]|nr:fibronectin type III domain-containing protein [Acidobacteriota bacterium]